MFSTFIRQGNPGSRSKLLWALNQVLTFQKPACLESFRTIKTFLSYSEHCYLICLSLNRTYMYEFLAPDVHNISFQNVWIILILVLILDDARELFCAFSPNLNLKTHSMVFNRDGRDVIIQVAHIRYFIPKILNRMMPKICNILISLKASNNAMIQLMFQSSCIGRRGSVIHAQILLQIEPLGRI